MGVINTEYVEYFILRKSEAMNEVFLYMVRNVGCDVKNTKRSVLGCFAFELL
jgi:hypothetical protein